MTRPASSTPATPVLGAAAWSRRGFALSLLAGALSACGGGGADDNGNNAGGNDNGGNNDGGNNNGGGSGGGTDTLTVTGFNPASGAAGDSITLTGTGFGDDLFHLLVTFSSGVTAEIVSASNTALVVKVPAGAVSGAITVTHSLKGVSDSSDTAFTVTSTGGGSGDTWTSRASPSSWLLNGLAYGNGVFVAVGYNRTILTSSDGLSWTAQTAPDSAYYENKGVIWTGSQFVLVGDMTYGGSQPAMLATSPDGVTWTRRLWTSSTDYEALTCAAAEGNDLTVGGANGTLAHSTDGGLNWAAETPGGGLAALHGLAAHGGTRVVVGRNSGYEGVIRVNTGSGWAATSGVSGIVPNDVIWTGSQFLAVGSTTAGLGNAAVATSADGQTWSVHALGSSEASAGFPLATALAVGSTLYATGDNLGNKHLIVASTDAGASWTVVHQATVSGNAMLAGMAASADRVVTVGGVKSVTLP